MRDQGYDNGLDMGGDKFGLVWFWALRSVFLLHEGSFDQDLLLKADSERLQTSMPGAGFEPATN